MLLAVIFVCILLSLIGFLIFELFLGQKSFLAIERITFVPLISIFVLTFFSVCLGYAKILYSKYLYLFLFLSLFLLFIYALRTRKIEKIDFKKYKLGLVDVFVILFFFLALYIRLYPISQTNLPYGSYDACTHFTLIEGHIISHDLYEYPKYFSNNYGGEIMPQGRNMYPPGFSSTVASLILMTDSGTANTLFTFAGVMHAFSVFLIYIICYRLFKSKAIGILASFFVIFSYGNLISLFIGVIPFEISLNIGLAVLYFFLRALNENETIFSAFVGFFAGFEFLYNPLGFLYTALVALLYFILHFSIKRDLNLFKHLLIIMACFFIIAAPFFYIFISWGDVISHESQQEDFKTEYLKDLIIPSYLKEKQLGGLPPDAYDLNERFGILWLILIVFGLFILFLFSKNYIISRNFLFILSWFLIDYFCTHLYLLASPLGYGQMAFYSGRWSQCSYHIFSIIASLIAIFGIKYSSNKINTNFNLVITRNVFSKSTFSIALIFLPLIAFLYIDSTIETSKSIKPSLTQEEADPISNFFGNESNKTNAAYLIGHPYAVYDQRRCWFEAISKIAMFSNEGMTPINEEKIGGQDYLNLSYYRPHKYKSENKTVLVYYYIKYIVIDNIQSYQTIDQFKNKYLDGVDPVYVSEDGIIEIYLTKDAKNTVQ